MAIHNRQRLIFALRNRASQVFTFHRIFIQIVLDTFQNFLIAPWLNTFNLRLAAATLSTTADSKKLVALWTIRENDHNVTETRRIFWISWTFRRVPTPDMMTVASQWFPANKVLLMITPFAEKVLYMNWKSALILNGSKMQCRYVFWTLSLISRQITGSKSWCKTVVEVRDGFTKKIAVL